jgi:hypothetical protein
MLPQCELKNEVRDRYHVDMAYIMWTRLTH